MVKQLVMLLVIWMQIDKILNKLVSYVTVFVNNKKKH